MNSSNSSTSKEAQFILNIIGPHLVLKHLVTWKHLLGFLEFIHKKWLIFFKTFEEDIFTGFTTFQATAVECPNLVLRCRQTSDFFITLLVDDSFV